MYVTANSLHLITTEIIKLPWHIINSNYLLHIELQKYMIYLYNIKAEPQENGLCMLKKGDTLKNGKDQTAKRSEQ